jgi:hypothetical protein
MSDEDFLKRWSRRKRESAEVAKVVGEPAARVAEATGPRPEGNIAKAEPPFDPATLPRIDSITAVSDISAFLREGVPAELTRAALRRVWTADPAIRDFVGLAENAWDFTDPDAMPGFGPLETSEDVRRMIARVVEQIGDVTQRGDPEAKQGSSNVSQTSNNSNPIESIRVEQSQAASAGPASGEIQEGAPEILDGQVLLQSNKDNLATQHDVAELPKNSSQMSRRSHGRALPR